MVREYARLDIIREKIPFMRPKGQREKSLSCAQRYGARGGQNSGANDQEALKQSSERGVDLMTSDWCAQRGCDPEKQLSGGYLAAPVPSYKMS